MLDSNKKFPIQLSWNLPAWIQIKCNHIDKKTITAMKTDFFQIRKSIA